jgi:hypothetical protein
MVKTLLVLSTMSLYYDTDTKSNKKGLLMGLFVLEMDIFDIVICHRKISSAKFKDLVIDRLVFHDGCGNDTARNTPCNSIALVVKVCQGGAGETVSAIRMDIESEIRTMPDIVIFFQSRTKLLHSQKFRLFHIIALIMTSDARGQNA